MSTMILDREALVPCGCGTTILLPLDWLIPGRADWGRCPGCGQMFRLLLYDGQLDALPVMS